MIQNLNPPNKKTLSEEVSRLYDSVCNEPDFRLGVATGISPLVNVYKSPSGAIVEALIPGVNLSDLQITVQAHTLTITKRCTPSVSHSDSEFFRTVDLPFIISGKNSSASSINGLLHVELARLESGDEDCESYLSIKDSVAEEESNDIPSTVLSAGKDLPPIKIPISQSIKVETHQRISARMVTPRTDIYEMDKCFLMEVMLPGIRKDGVTVSINQGVLTIEARAKDFSRQDHPLVYIEFSMANYRRKVSLFDGIDARKATALLRNGSLQIRLPKKNKNDDIKRSLSDRL